MNIKFENEEYNNILSYIKKNEHVNKDNVCAICRDTLLIDTIDLSCKHRYHTTCLLSSFNKYETKKCPLCSEHFLIDTYTTTCCKIMKSKKVCNKKCYNNERLCSVHIRTYLKELEREKKSIHKKEISLIKRKIKSKETKLKKLTQNIITLNTEIMHLSIELKQLQ
jgi:hypothetical protein